MTYIVEEIGILKKRKLVGVEKLAMTAQIYRHYFLKKYLCFLNEETDWWGEKGSLIKR